MECFELRRVGATLRHPSPAAKPSIKYLLRSVPSAIGRVFLPEQHSQRCVGRNFRLGHRADRAGTL